MPFAIFDRDEFIERTGLGPDMRVLEIGPDHNMAVQMAGSVETRVAVAVSSIKHARAMRALSVQNIDPVVLDYEHGPFKDCSFDTVFSYHTLNHVPDKGMPDILAEVRRMLKEQGRFASLIWSLKPANRAHASNLMLLNLLEKLGLVYCHGFAEVSRWLEAAGFEEITMELITSTAVVPETWVRARLRRLELMVEELKNNGNGRSTDLEKELESYSDHVMTYGEELLPAIQFTATRGTGLKGIDVVQ